MITWFWIFSILYIALLIFASTRTYKKDRTIEDFMLAGSNIGALLGVLNYAAALFSAFIFMGMPDFFRVPIPQGLPMAISSVPSPSKSVWLT